MWLMAKWMNERMNEWMNEWINETKTGPKKVAEIKPTLKIVNIFNKWLTKDSSLQVLECLPWLAA